MPHMGRHWEPVCIYSSLRFQRDLLVSRDSNDRSTPDWLFAHRNLNRSGSF